MVRQGGPDRTDGLFFDLYNWPISNDNRLTIREKLLEAEYMVAWITPHYLANNRGWVWFELAYAELIENSLNDRAGPRMDYDYFVVPYFSPEIGVEQLERSPLLRYWERKAFRPDESRAISDVARRLVDFHEQEILKRRGPR